MIDNLIVANDPKQKRDPRGDNKAVWDVHPREKQPNSPWRYCHRSFVVPDG